MSLRDTIDGARREIQDGNGGEMPKPKPRAKNEDELDAKAKAEAKAEASRMSYARKSAASAKPATQAASSVRTVSGKSTSVSTSSSTSKEQEKEAKKEAKRRRREEEDFRNQGYDIVVRSLPDYKKYDRIWWVLLITGFAFAVISLIVAYIFPTDDYATLIGTVSAVTLVAAYAFIIGAFVFDLVKRRPLRKQAESIVQGMTDKKIGDLIEKERKHVIAEETEKEAAKAAKRAAKDSKRGKKKVDEE